MPTGCQAPLSTPCQAVRRQLLKLVTCSLVIAILKSFFGRKLCCIQAQNLFVRSSWLYFVHLFDQDARLYVGRHRVQIVGRREPPARLPFVEKTVIAQMVVGIGDQDIEHHPLPECRHVGLGRGPVLAQRVDDFNDRFRAELFVPSLGPRAVPGRIVCTSGIATLPPETEICIWAEVANFNRFTEDNDPHGEHDFGAFDIEDAGTIFWKDRLLRRQILHDRLGRSRRYGRGRSVSSPSCWRRSGRHGYGNPARTNMPMGVKTSRIVEITDEDETIIITFVPVDAVRRRHHDHDHHEEQAAG